MNSESKDRVCYFDVLNILSCIAVLALHHNGIVWQFSDSWTWRTSLVVECFAYWAVPVFLMLSGATLLNYRTKYSTKEFFKKRIIRTAIPWLFWSVIFLIWKMMTGQIVVESYNPFYLFNLILSNKVENVYWYFTALFGVYLSIPILSPLIQFRKTLWYLVGVNFIFVGVVPVVNQLLGTSFQLSVYVTTGLIVFPVLGYLLSTTQIDKRKRIALYIAGILATLFRYVYTYIKSYENGTTDSTIKGYGMFYSVLLAAAVFVLIKQIPWNRLFSEKTKKLISIIASCSFGIYLIHMMVIYYERIFFPFASNLWIWRTIGIIITYVISLFIVYILGNIPLIKVVIGK